jgi:hypothetical protein
MLIMLVIERIMDANFHQHARKMGVEVVENKQPKITLMGSRIMGTQGKNSKEGGRQIQ